MKKGPYILLSLISLLLVAVTPVRAKPSRTSDWGKFVEKIVEQDSRNWLFNRFDFGSVHNARIVAETNDRRTLLVSADYTFNRGAVGSVRMVLVDGRLACTEYWDRPGMCHGYIPTELLSLYAGPSGSHGGRSVEAPPDRVAESDSSADPLALLVGCFATGDEKFSDVRVVKEGGRYFFSAKVERNGGWVDYHQFPMNVMSRMEIKLFAGDASDDIDAALAEHNIKVFHSASGVSVFVLGKVLAARRVSCS